MLSDIILKTVLDEEHKNEANNKEIFQMIMINDLMDLLERRQEQIFKEKTDLYGRFKSSKDEAFLEGYLECMQDVYYFFEDKKKE